MNSIKPDEVTRRAPDVRITSVSLQRSARGPNASIEEEAFGELSQLLAADSRRATQRVVEMALRCAGAGSAGLSLLRTNSSDHAEFEWQSVAGALAGHQGDGTPRGFSPCGRCLDAGSTLLFSRPEREFTYLARLQPTIFDAAFVPVYDHDDRPMGALWIAHHDPVTHISADDLRLLERLAIWTKPLVSVWVQTG